MDSVSFWIKEDQESLNLSIRSSTETLQYILIDAVNDGHVKNIRCLGTYDITEKKPDNSSCEK